MQRPVNKPFAEVWAKTYVGDAIFVPTLTPNEVLVEGLHEAQKADCTVLAQVGIVDGRLGVLFTVKRVPRARP